MQSFYQIILECVAIWNGTLEETKIFFPSCWCQWWGKTSGWAQSWKHEHGKIGLMYYWLWFLVESWLVVCSLCGEMQGMRTHSMVLAFTEIKLWSTTGLLHRSRSVGKFNWGNHNHTRAMVCEQIRCLLWVSIELDWSNSTSIFEPCILSFHKLWNLWLFNINWDNGIEQQALSK